MTSVPAQIEHSTDGVVVTTSRAEHLRLHHRNTVEVAEDAVDAVLQDMIEVLAKVLSCF